jgi:hypothetical protein
MHVQLTRSSVPSADLERRLSSSLPATPRPVSIVLWPYERFPYGMTVDYERKFSYFQAT